MNGPPHAIQNGDVDCTRVPYVVLSSRSIAARFGILAQWKKKYKKEYKKREMIMLVKHDWSVYRRGVSIRGGYSDQS